MAFGPDLEIAVSSPLALTTSVPPQLEPFSSECESRQQTYGNRLVNRIEDGVNCQVCEAFTVSLYTRRGVRPVQQVIGAWRGFPLNDVNLAAVVKSVLAMAALFLHKQRSAHARYVCRFARPAMFPLLQ